MTHCVIPHDRSFLHSIKPTGLPRSVNTKLTSRFLCHRKTASRGFSHLPYVRARLEALDFGRNTSLHCRKFHATHTPIPRFSHGCFIVGAHIIAYAWHTMKHQTAAVHHRSHEETSLLQLPPVEPPLSAQLGFVVQFRTRTGQSSTYFAGRVEHFTSGTMTHFHTPEELTEFLWHMLNTQGMNPEEPQTREQ